MGAVYLARDERLGRDVAVKLIKPELATDAAIVERFSREARAAAALDHPGIVTVHDVGTEDTPDGAVPYLVLERLRGESFAARLARAPISYGEAATLVAEALDALAVAHDSGIVHRDIKPENLFLCESPRRVKVLDFGVADIRNHAPEDPRLTDAGAGIGTPAFMAPEQLRGEVVDARADLYAAGAMLFEAMAGEPAYAAATLPLLMSQKLNEPARPLREVNPAVPPALAEIVDQALAHHPGDRPASARAMGARLRAAALDTDSAGSRAGEDPYAATMTPADFARALPSTDPHAATMTPTQVQVGRDSAEAPARPATATPPHVDKREGRAPIRLALVALAVGACGLAGWWALRSPTDPAVVSGEAPALPMPPSARPEPTRALEILARFVEASGSARVEFESADLWEQCVESFAALPEGRARPARWRAGEALCRAQAHDVRGEIEAARAQADAALEADETWASAHLVRGSFAARDGEMERAIRETRRARELARDWWVPESSLGVIYLLDEEPAEAVQAFRRAHRIAPEEPNVLDDLAIAMHFLRNDTEATRYAELALAADAEMTRSRIVLAERALEAEEHEAALAHANRALTTRPTMASAHLARADALAHLGRREDAMNAYREALRLHDAQRQRSLSEERVAAVRAALESERLPHEVAASSARSRGTTRRQRSRSRSRAMSAVGMRSGDMRVLRSRPSPLNSLDF